MKGCKLGFNKILEGKKYKMAMDALKRRGLKRGSSTEYEKKFSVDYITMCVMLLSIAEKARPVTIVDILRRQKVTAHIPSPPLGVCAYVRAAHAGLRAICFRTLVTVTICNRRRQC